MAPAAVEVTVQASWNFSKQGNQVFKKEKPGNRFEVLGSRKAL
jgi:hypothetical protein